MLNKILSFLNKTKYTSTYDFGVDKSTKPLPITFQDFQNIIELFPSEDVFSNSWMEIIDPTNKYTIRLEKKNEEFIVRFQKHNPMSTKNKKAILRTFEYFFASKYIEVGIILQKSFQ